MGKKARGGSKKTEAGMAGFGVAGGPLKMPKPAMDHHVSIRKISNGYVLRHSGTRGDGQYFERETFSPKQPKIHVTPTKGK